MDYQIRELVEQSVQLVVRSIVVGLLGLGAAVLIGLLAAGAMIAATLAR